MKIAGLNSSQKVIVIAEIGNNHEGSFERAKLLARLAAEAGADIIKYQTFVPELYANKQDEARIARLKGFRLSFEQFAELARTVESLGKVFLSTPFDLDSAQFLGSLHQAPAIKIGSGENTFWPLLRAVALSRKPLIVSTGISGLDEVLKIRDFVRSAWSEIKHTGELAILHCVSAYPAPPEQINLRSIPALAKATGCEVGFSDHTAGISAAVGAVALGARIIEKHFTDNKNFSSFRDHQLSADPIEFREMVLRIREMEVMLGTEGKVTQVAEEPAAVSMRRSIINRRELKAGEAIQLADLAWVRPGGGIPPGHESEVIGKHCVSNIAVGTVLTRELVR